MSRLFDLLNDCNTEQLPARRIQAIAANTGVVVDNTFISKYLRGEPESLSESVLEAFSVTSKIPMSTLREVLAHHLVSVNPWSCQSGRIDSTPGSVSWSCTRSGYY